LEFATTIAIAFLSAYFGAFLALRKYKHEKQWQEKLAAYKEIFDALGNLMLWADETYSRVKMLPTTGVKEGTGFYQGYTHARVCLLKYSSIGRLVLCSEFSDKLEEINSELWQSEFSYEDTVGDPQEYEEALAAHARQVKSLIDARLASLVKLAKNDTR
jgi:hypothetical protein